MKAQCLSGGLLTSSLLHRVKTVLTQRQPLLSIRLCISTLGSKEHRALDRSHSLCLSVCFSDFGPCAHRQTQTSSICSFWLLSLLSCPVSFEGFLSSLSSPFCLTLSVVLILYALWHPDTWCRSSTPKLSWPSLHSTFLHFGHQHSSLPLLLDMPLSLSKQHS